MPVRERVAVFLSSKIIRAKQIISCASDGVKRLEKPNFYNHKRAIALLAEANGQSTVGRRFALPYGYED